MKFPAILRALVLISLCALPVMVRAADTARISDAWARATPGQAANCAVVNEFAQTVEILKRVALGADLRGELGFLGKIIGADNARLLDGVRQRLFAIHILLRTERGERH